MPNTVFPARLKQALTEGNVTTREAGEWLGVTPAQIGNFTSGRRSASIEEATILARRLGKSLDWLVGLSDERREALTDDHRDALAVIRALEEIGLSGVARALEGDPGPDPGEEGEVIEGTIGFKKRKKTRPRRGPNTEGEGT